MIKHIWTVLCQKTIIDKDSNNISVIDVMEELKINYSFKENNSNNNEINRINIPIKYEIVSLWMRDKYDLEENIDLKIVLNDPNGKELKTFDQKVVMKENLLRYRTIVKFEGIGLNVPGVYLFEIKIKENGKENYRSVANVPLEVKITKNLNKKTNELIN